MSWSVAFHPKFAEECNELSEAVQDELVASLALLRDLGPALGRPDVDTLNDSHYANMKELRFKADGGVGGSPSRSILGARGFCLSPGTNRA